ncbi:MAG: TraB/GumN family protein [Candidatus Nanohaloarchaeota archaeon QJJ-9]|nr:TraB/GumN family protein [Candidatus Nanohaloarchaeota archaeon QJJ-9]
MIELIGTSHIAEESLEEVKQKINETNPKIVALELDPGRYQSLKTGGKGEKPKNPILMIISFLQEQLSLETGIKPGTEMLEASKAAEKLDIPVALIDQDIKVTAKKIGGISLLEKTKLLAYLTVGLLFPLSSMEIDLNKVPEEELVEEMTLRLKIAFPNLYQALIKERNQIMSQRLLELERRYGKVLGVVGAGHIKGLKEELRERSINQQA